MPHPALRPGAISRLRSRLGPATPAVSSTPGVADQGRLAGSGRRLFGHVAAPLFERATARVSEAARRDTTALRAEVDQLRADLARTRSELEAELALLRAEVAGRP